MILKDTNLISLISNLTEGICTILHLIKVTLKEDLNLLIIIVNWKYASLLQRILVELQANKRNLHNPNDTRKKQGHLLQLKIMSDVEDLYSR